MRYGDLRTGDTFAVVGYYVKQPDGSALKVRGSRAGKTVEFSDNYKLDPLPGISERITLMSLIEAAENMSSALWNQEHLPEGSALERLEKLDDEVKKAKKSLKIL